MMCSGWNAWNRQDSVCAADENQYSTRTSGSQVYNSQKIIHWVTDVEQHLKLKPPVNSAEAMALQVVITDWSKRVNPESSESFFRASVEHGVNVQYETIMSTEDEPNAKTHHFWADLEAARAEACLALTGK